VIYGNKIYNSNGTDVNITCGYSGPDSETTVPLKLFTDHGLMKVRSN
jgi:hypothetical protein